MGSSGACSTEGPQMDTCRLADLTIGEPTLEVGAPPLSRNVAQPTMIYKVELGLLIEQSNVARTHTHTPTNTALPSIPL
jgi:hypothetical protein